MAFVQFKTADEKLQNRTDYLNNLSSV